MGQIKNIKLHIVTDIKRTSFVSLKMAGPKIAEMMKKIAAGGGGGAASGGAALALSGLYGISQSFYTVDGGHRAIIFSRIGGVQDRVYSEGLHFRVPWFQYPIIYDIRAKPRR